MKLSPSLAIKARVNEAPDAGMVTNLEIFDVLADLEEEAEVFIWFRCHDDLLPISYLIIPWSPPRQSRVLEPMERERAWAWGPSQSGCRCDRCRNTWDYSKF